jgi:hypothetical protein
MYLIKTCPRCKTKLRFPIDKGTLRVKCACGYSFIANPDNPDMFKDASFDLSHSTCGVKKMAPLRQALAGIKFDRIIPAIITGSLEIKYKIQNFRLLPGAEKKRIILYILLLGTGIAGIAVVIYLLTHFSCTNQKIII